MNKLLHTPVHRMTARATAGAGIRWSSYVGDVRCTDNLSKSYFPAYDRFKTLHNHNFITRAGSGSVGNGLVGHGLVGHGRAGGPNRKSADHARRTSRAFSTPAKPPTKHTTVAASTRKHSSVHGARRDVPHERLLVLGSGVAGCAAALTAARHGVPVTVLHAGSEKEDCNSYWAQGGIIYRNYGLTEEKEFNGLNGAGSHTQLVDTPLSLVNDIRKASGYRSPLQRTHHLEERAYSSDLVLNDQSSSKMGRVCPSSGVNWNEDAAWKLACEGPSRVRELLLGSKDAGLGESHGCVVPFDRTGLNDSDVLSLCLEASHAAPRIIHHADCTGKAITTSITRAASEHPLIEFVGDSVVTDLIADDGMVIGAQVLNKRTNGLSDCYAVHGVVLASGGLAGIYQHSTNPLGFNALGSSVGLALRLEDHIRGGRRSNLALRLEDRLSGSESNGNGIVSDLEYVQFHPTSLYLPGEARFLLTEALRGEGAILRDADGRAFARDYHPDAELAPRDVVARAVFSESQKGGGKHNAYLDITHHDPEWLRGRFPTIHAHLSSRAVPMDFTQESIPVIPAAHYTCGGVTTDLDGRVVGEKGWYGNLYAAGEAARTGLHGGNRLASTSLLEGLVFGASVGETVAGVAGGEDADDAALEAREGVVEATDRARHSIEQRLVTEQYGRHKSIDGGAAVDGRTRREAAAVLAHLKSVMWDNVGVVREPSKLARAASELAAVRDEADRLWGEGSGGAGWEAAALRDAARAGLAVAEAAAANRVSGGAHYVVSEEDAAAEVDELKEQDSDDEDDGLVAVRA